jgi:hypothetical protein
MTLIHFNVLSFFSLWYDFEFHTLIYLLSSEFKISLSTWSLQWIKFDNTFILLKKIQIGKETSIKIDRKRKNIIGSDPFRQCHCHCYLYFLNFNLITLIIKIRIIWIIKCKKKLCKPSYGTIYLTRHRISSLNSSSIMSWKRQCTFLWSYHHAWLTSPLLFRWRIPWKQEYNCKKEIEIQKENFISEKKG